MSSQIIYKNNPQGLTYLKVLERALHVPRQSIEQPEIVVTSTDSGVDKAEGTGANEKSFSRVLAYKYYISIKTPDKKTVAFEICFIPRLPH